MTFQSESRSLPSEIKTPADVAAYRDATIKGQGMLPGGPALFDQLCDLASIGAARSETGAIVIEEGFTYWTHEGHIMRRHYTGSPHDSIEALGPGGWTEVP